MFSSFGVFGGLRGLWGLRGLCFQDTPFRSPRLELVWFAHKHFPAHDHIVVCCPLKVLASVKMKDKETRSYKKVPLDLVVKIHLAASRR